MYRISKFYSWKEEALLNVQIYFCDPILRRTFAFCSLQLISRKVFLIVSLLRLHHIEEKVSVLPFRRQLIGLVLGVILSARSWPKLQHQKRNYGLVMTSPSLSSEYNVNILKSNHQRIENRCSMTIKILNFLEVMVILNVDKRASCVLHSQMKWNCVMIYCL